MKVDVIIPCFNVERYIEECLDSVKLQGKSVRKVFCVDNNSTDETVSTIQKWTLQNPELELELLHEQKPGACSARNKPLSLVETEWIQFLDADDLLLEGKIEFQLIQTEDCDVIYDSSLKKSTGGEIRNIIPENNIELGLMNGNLGNTCANLWRKSTLEVVDGWNEELSSSQEYDLLIRIYKTGGRFKRLNSLKTLIQTRECGQISQGNKKLLWENNINVRFDLIDSVLNLKMDNRIKAEFYHIYFEKLRMLHKYDSLTAINNYDKTFRSINYKPRVCSLNTRLYVIFFSIFGFRLTEKIRLLFRFGNKRS